MGAFVEELWCAAHGRCTTSRHIPSGLTMCGAERADDTHLDVRSRRKTATAPSGNVLDRFLDPVAGGHDLALALTRM